MKMAREFWARELDGFSVRIPLPHIRLPISSSVVAIPGMRYREGPIEAER
jgi:hypothetical protein